METDKKIETETLEFSKSERFSFPGSVTAVVDDTTNHELIINDFIEAIRTNREPIITGESARNATEIVLEIYRWQF